MASTTPRRARMVWMPVGVWAITPVTAPLASVKISVDAVTLKKKKVTHRELRTARRIRLVFDELAEALMPG